MDLFFRAQVKADDFVFLSHDQSAMAQRRRAATESFNFGPCDGMTATVGGLQHPEVRAVVLENHQLAIGKNRGRDGALHLIFHPANFTGRQLNALIFASTG